jgi:hypothetical protein
VLDLTASREAADGLALSNAVTARWTFTSGTAPEDGADVLLLSLDAPLPLDVHNAAPRGRAMTCTVSGRGPGADPARPGPVSLRLTARGTGELAVQQEVRDAYAVR